MVIDWNAMFEIEQRLTQRRGGGVWVSMQDLGDVSKLSIADMRTVIWGSLIHEDEALTEKQVGAMVHGGNQGYVCDKLAEAMAGDEEATEETTGRPTAQKNGSDPLGGDAG
jgi:hypothetical protein